jgi:transglutaminase-like putative cysteine protease
MRLTIQHITHYHYGVSPKQWVQLLRLTPRNEMHQHVLSWNIITPGQLTTFVDAFRNQSHVHVVREPYTDLRILVEGVVELTPLLEGRLPCSVNENIPALAYLMPTVLTEGCDAIAQLAAHILPNGLNTPSDALNLASAITKVVHYTAGTTDVNSTAAQAFQLGSGVCQDHAHIMIAACRSLVIPARYVSGYVDPGHSRAAASHAWVDVYIHQNWYSIDVTNGSFASDAHCRLAVGRDYLDASPIRGVRDGGDSERLNVLVNVQGI